jgi:hypothetical protein
MKPNGFINNDATDHINVQGYTPLCDLRLLCVSA